MPGQYTTIQAAIDAAEAGDAIIIADGKYTGEGNYNIDFGGKAITVRSENGPGNCVIDCQATEGHRGFIFHSNEDENSRVEGLTISNGYEFDGGGILCDNSSPVISGCNFDDNYAINWGGAIYCSKSSAVISNCSFISNRASYGGAIATSSEEGNECNTVIKSCIIAYNVAFYTGGGIHCDAFSNPVISSCLVLRNDAHMESGGGISIYQSNAEIHSCSIIENSSGGKGGGISQWYPYESGSHVKNCIIRRNGAMPGPQVSVSEGAQLSISYTDLEGGESEIYKESEDAVNWGTGNIDADPKFDFENFYHLEANSPCIGAGDPEGDYTGQTDIDGEPRLMGARVDVGSDEFPMTSSPFIIISNDYFIFDANEGRESPPSQTLLIRNAGSETLSWEIVPDCSWLHVNPTIGSSDGETDEVTLSPDINDMPAGTYACQLMISGDCETCNFVFAAVELIVKGPIMDLSQNQFKFLVTEQEPNPGNQTLTIRNKGGGTLDWRITESCDWLEVEPTMGGCIDQPNEVSLTVNKEGMQPGVYSTNLTVSSDEAENSPQSVNIVLHIAGEFHVPQDYTTIQSAIDMAGDGDVVIIAQGVYKGSGNRDLNFHGKSVRVRSIDQNNPDVVAATIIDCNGTQAAPHRGFRLNSGETREAVIAGLTIINGYAPNENHYGGMKSVGGAIWCWGASPSITDCIISNNRAGAIGGGIYARESNCAISRCIISGNSAMELVGGIHLRTGSPEVSDCIIKNNSGCGIYMLGCTKPSITGCMITGNNAGSERGGGIYSSGNIDKVTITNCIIYKNSASTGGGICFHNDNGSQYVKNCTITGNSATYYGGGIRLYGFTGSVPRVENSIIWANTAPNGPQIYDSIHVSYSDIQGGYTGLGNINKDPLFVNGYRLSQNAAGQGLQSPCVDKGSGPVSFSGIVYTTRTDGLTDEGIVDMGYHYTSSTGSPDIDGSDRIDMFDFAVPASKWLNCGMKLAGDLTQDGCVDVNDILLITDNWLDCSIGYSGGPSPADGAINVDPNADLLWSTGARAIAHDIYFGTSSDAVANADRQSPEFMQTMTGTSFDPGKLANVTNYYWRIDEIGSICDTKGSVWSFTTRGETIIFPSPVSRWKFDETTGTIANDCEGENDGTLKGNTAWTTGQIDGALNFDGNSDYVLVGDKANLEPAALTFSFWAQLDNPGGSVQGGVGKGFLFGTGYEYSYSLNFHGGLGRACITNTSNSAFAVTTGVGDNDWHFWVMTADAGVLTIYKDNQAGVNTSYSGNLDYTKDENSFVIGARHNGDFSFYGKIDDVRVYNNALTDAEVMQLYLNGADL